jgi:predicted site-specific integrase-resolvase
VLRVLFDRVIVQIHSTINIKRAGLRPVRNNSTEQVIVEYKRPESPGEVSAHLLQPSKTEIRFE